MPDEPNPVFFLMPDGTEISDDPRWREQQFRKRIDSEQAELKASVEKAAREQLLSDQASTLTLPEEAEEISGKRSPLDDMTVEQLKAEALELDLDISGIKKKSELIALLKEQR